MNNPKLNTSLSKPDPTESIPDDLAEWLDAPSVGNEVFTVRKDKLITSEIEYRAALKEIERLFDVIPNTAKGDELETWILLVESYEDEHFPL